MKWEPINRDPPQTQKEARIHHTNEWGGFIFVHNHILALVPANYVATLLITSFPFDEGA